MRCIKCGAQLSDPGYCSRCGAEIKIYNKLIRLSNTYYNMGLEKAQVRNLSGAVEDLKRSLELNKNNIQARNLLGLIYFETGETVPALTEWIISKNLEPEKNIADDYIDEIQANAGRLETINQTIKKYNQTLLYCSQGSVDLAVIQLKKVLSLNPKFVKAHQLLALLYIKTGEYDRAGRELKRALDIDKTDNISLHYLEELETLTGRPAGKTMKEEEEKKSKSGRRNPEVITYTSGNETIIQPAVYKENTGLNVVLNIFIGFIVGVALMWFLALPAKVQSVRSEANEQIREYSDQISAKQSEIDSLEADIEDLEASLDELETVEEETDAAESYVNLIDAYTSYIAGDTETAASLLESVVCDELSDNAQSIYNEMYAVLYAEEIEELYQTGSSAYSSGDYEAAVAALSQVVEVEAAYGDGYAVYYLARSYENLGENELAVEMFEIFIENYPGTERATYSQSAVTRLQSETE